MIKKNLHCHLFELSMEEVVVEKSLLIPAAATKCFKKYPSLKTVNERIQQSTVDRCNGYL